MQTSISMFPLKINHVISRYQSIAPKPMPKFEGTNQIDFHSLFFLLANKNKLASMWRSKHLPYASKSHCIAKKIWYNRMSLKSFSRKSGEAK